MVSFLMLSVDEELISHLSDFDPDENYFSSITNLLNSTNDSNLI